MAAAAAAARRIVLLAGLSASGKTTLGERMERECGWTHFDGDKWMSGGDPVPGSGAALPKGDRPAVRLAFARAQAEAYEKLFVHEPPNHEAFEAFYTLMCEDVGRVARQLPSQSVVVTHSVYCAATRAFIRDRLLSICDDVRVVVIRCSKDALVDRRTARARLQAEAAGLSLEDYLAQAMQNGFALDAPTEEAFRRKVEPWNNGFEEATEGEGVVDVIDGAGVDDMARAFKAIALAPAPGT